MASHNTRTYPNQFTNSPLIQFTKVVGNDNLKQMIQATIEHTINTLAGEVDFSNRTLNVVLTRANTGCTGGWLKVAVTKDGVKLDWPMELMVNIGKGSLQATIMHETIHYLQYQLKILNAAYLNGLVRGGSSYLWDNATGALLSARGHNQEVLNMMTEGRTWRTEAHMTSGEGVTTYKGANATLSAHSKMKYYLEPCERQAHRLCLSIGHRLQETLNLSESDLESMRAMRMRSMNARAQYDNRRSGWTVAHL